MKKVPLKKLPVDDGQNTLNYKDQFVMLLRQPSDSSKGADYEEITKVVPVIDAIQKADEAKGYLLLEDDQHKVLEDRLKNQKFMVIDSAILQMITDVSTAQVVNVQAVEDEDAAH